MLRVLRIALVALALVLVAIVGGAVWARWTLRDSLPALDGTHRLAGLTSPVAVTRDALGIPTLRGASRADVARALGFLHAQDRFFQMDLARRRAAGELAALVGSRALVVDRPIRLHRFRAEARRAVALLSAADRAVLDAYTAGVNDGLRSLGSRPFEYVLLRQTPAPWRSEDSLLVVLSMFITLQEPDGTYESTLGTMHEVLPPAMFDFLAPRGTEWDAPIDGSAEATPPIPGAEVYNLRARRSGHPTSPLPPRPPRLALDHGSPAGSTWPLAPLSIDTDAVGTRRDEALGSNNWAVGASLTPDGHALVANDMHLAIRVPNTWYRAAMEWPDDTNPSTPHRLIGTTLPGVPTLVTGSNTHVAWGFTNTYADWSDLVTLDVDAAHPDQYRTPEGWRGFEHVTERLESTDTAPESMDVRWTIWGPVLDVDHTGRPRAYSWVAHSAERLATSLLPLETVRTVDEAFDRANGAGIPGQNLVAVDRDGHIGWSVFGAIPRRVGFDGVLPSSWADGTRRWDGWLTPAEFPRVVDPGSGRIWTANARVVGGTMLATLGDGSYEMGSRARQIQERLTERASFTPRDMLAIQLDTRAEFLDRWHTLLLRTLTPQALAGHAQRAALRAILDRDWTGQASPSSAAYQFTRRFRDLVSDRVIRFVLSECYEADPTFDYFAVRRREGAIWKVLTERPLHLLDPAFASWDDLVLAAVDETIADTSNDAPADLNARTWAARNVLLYQHPLSAALPLLGRWLDMPRLTIPGDAYTIRVQSGVLGASIRMVVSPGQEAQGLMHMPTGQSGHPLSPYYANSHPAWAEGRPTPFLPGPPEHTLTLTP